MLASDIQDQEVNENYEAFLMLLPDLMQQNAGHYAVLHNQSLIDIYPSLDVACKAALAQFKDQPFSIQEITDASLDLGMFSYAATDW